LIDKLNEALTSYNDARNIPDGEIKEELSWEKSKFTLVRLAKKYATGSSVD